MSHSARMKCCLSHFRVKWLWIVAALWAIIAFAKLDAQEVVEEKIPRPTQLASAYGFVLGQSRALELVGEKYPDLLPRCREIAMSWTLSALGQGGKDAELEIASLLGPKWQQERKKLEAQTSELIGKQQVSRDQAVAILNEVAARVKGKLPETTRATLLSANARYAKSPGLEIVEGWKQTYRTKDHPKSKGADFSIDLPASWSGREGNRPNIIQFFQSGAGHGNLACVLMVQDLPLEPGQSLSMQDIDELVRSPEIQEMLPDGAAMLSAETLPLEGCPTAMIVCDYAMERMQTKLILRMTQFMIFHKRQMLLIQFIVSALPEEKQKLDPLQKQYLPTMKTIMNTLVLNDRY